MEQKPDKNNILLSICIPTFNRAPLLKMAVESVLSQIDETKSDQVEIIISDNASTDGTAAVMEGIRKASKAQIRYFLNESNVGAENNFLLSVERARGQYAWILGSDDLVAPGALKSIVQELREPAQVDIYFCEKEDFYLSPDRPMRFRRIMRSPRESIYDFRSKQTVDEYFSKNKRLIAYCNFISNIVFSRAKWLGVTDKEEFVGTEYVHVYVFQSILWGNDPGIMKYLPFPLVRRRWGTDGLAEPESRMIQDVKMFRRIAEEVFPDKKYVRLIDKLVLINDGYSWAVRAKINDRWGFYLKLFPLLWRYYWDLPLFWLKIVPLLFVPNLVLKIMRNFYRKIVKGEPVSAREMFDS